MRRRRRRRQQTPNSLFIYFIYISYHWRYVNMLCIAISVHKFRADDVFLIAFAGIYSYVDGGYRTLYHTLYRIKCIYRGYIRCICTNYRYVAITVVVALNILMRNSVPHKHRTHEPFMPNRQRGRSFGSWVRWIEFKFVNVNISSCGYNMCDFE